MAQIQKAYLSERQQSSQLSNADLRQALERCHQETLCFQSDLHRNLMSQMSWRYLYSPTDQMNPNLSTEFQHSPGLQLSLIKQYETLKDYLDWDWQHKYDEQAHEQAWIYLLQTEINEHYFHYFDQKLRQFQGLPLNWEDYDLKEADLELILEFQLHWTDESLSQLDKVNFYWMIMAHKSEAERLQVQKEMLQNQKRVKAEAEAKVALRVQQQACFVLKQDNYFAKDYGQVIQGLESLALVISPEELSIFLNSPLFAQRVSIKLHHQLLNFWAKEHAL